MTRPTTSEDAIDSGFFPRCVKYVATDHPFDSRRLHHYLNGLNFNHLEIRIEDRDDFCDQTVAGIGKPTENFELSIILATLHS